jgi:hypothetical protein
MIEGVLTSQYKLDHGEESTSTNEINLDPIPCCHFDTKYLAMRNLTYFSIET